MQQNYNENQRKKSTQFWKQVSNGLRTPLNVIKGTADIAQNEIYDIETVKEGFQRIGESSEFLLNVVNDIVDYVALENGELEITKQTFNLNAMITQFIKKYYNKAAAQKKHLDAQIHAVLHENLVGDEHRVEQILDCMLINSLRYTSEKDSLYFEIFETGVSENQVSMRFTMTGTNRKMYDYLTGTVNGKVVTEATDLALYNSHYILLKMGGSIKVELDADEKSKIIIDMVFGIDEDSAVNNALFEQEWVLIICDSRKEAEARGELLSEMKAGYSTAVDHEEALELIGRAEESGTPYSACIVDWNLKNFSVQDFVNDVHNIFGNDMPLIAMAYDVDEVKEQAFRIGFAYVMEHTWFRSTICRVLMDRTKGLWKKNETDVHRKKYDFRNKHILVTEDSPLNMDFIVHILTNVHADVTCASNGMEAYNLFRQKPEYYYDCILMDINMPEMDGYEATSIIRKTDRSDAGSVPIFALTANAFQSDIREALNAGMNGHFSKPVDVTRMYEVLEDLFRKVREGRYDGQTETEQKIEALKRESEEKKDVYDPLTGLLTLYGLEEQLTSRKYKNHPVGFLLVEIRNYEQIVRLQGQHTAERLICRLAEQLKEEFRISDLIARYSEACYAVVLNYCDNGIAFADNKIRIIYEEINKENEMALIEICCGASYSEYGYSGKMASLSFEALEHGKQSGRLYTELAVEASFLNGADSFLNEADSSEYLNKTIFGMEMFYLKGRQITEIDHIDELLVELLGKNQAVGIMCGTFEEGLPVCLASGFALKNIGYDAASFMKETGGLLANAVHPDDCRLLKEYAVGHEPEVKKIRFKHKDGDIRWFNAAYISAMTRTGERMWITSLRPDDENVVGNLCDKDYLTVSVILPEENVIILEKGSEAIYTDDLKLRRRYNYGSLLKAVFAQMHKKDDKEEFLHNMSIDNLLLQLEQKGIYEFISYKIEANGESSPIRYKFRYIDETKRAILLTQEYVENLAESDDVTCLLNEKGFQRNVKKILRQEENADTEYVILYANIKDFKSCNEMLGFAGGNALLRFTADYIGKSELQPVCSARFHADQFYFLIEKEKLDYDRVNSLCYSKVKINGNSLNLRILCGIYEIGDRSQDVSTMCDKAVLAAESITNEYASPYYIFDDQVNQKYQNRMFVLNNMERAFVRDEFRVYYQPVCDVKTGRVVSAESLIRWIMPGGKVVSPGVFVPVLENKGYITKLDLLVMDKVRQFTEGRVMAGRKAVPVSINLSRMDFLNETFIRDLQEQIAQIRVDKALFRYEVTESAYINIGDGGRMLVEEIRKNQSQIYIDDFGTGYSSLQNLMEIQFDVLKLDMYFVRRIGQNVIAEGVIDAVIRVCHGLGRKVIAEGVETEEQFRFLAERDCDYIQGYYFHKPMPEAEFAKLLDSESEE